MRGGNVNFLHSVYLNVSMTIIIIIIIVNSLCRFCNKQERPTGNNTVALLLKESQMKWNYF